MQNYEKLIKISHNIGEIKTSWLTLFKFGRINHNAELLPWCLGYEIDYLAHWGEHKLASEMIFFQVEKEI